MHTESCMEAIAHESVFGVWFTEANYVALLAIRYAYIIIGKPYETHIGNFSLIIRRKTEPVMDFD